MHSLPNPFARSLVDSVFPVPAGPAGEAPKLFARALVMVIQHLSVRGVMTSLDVAPRYSYPYSMVAVTCLTRIESESSGAQYLSCCCQQLSWMDSTSLLLRVRTISLLCTSVVMRATRIFLYSSDKSPLTISVSIWSCLRFWLYYWARESGFPACSLIASSVLLVHMIWLTTATTCPICFRIHSFLLGVALVFLIPSLIALFKVSIISFWRFISHASTLALALIGLKNFTLSPSGLFIPSIEVGLSGSIISFTNPSKHLFRCCSTASKFCDFARISRSSSFDKKQNLGKSFLLTSRQSSSCFSIWSSDSLVFTRFQNKLLIFKILLSFGLAKVLFIKFLRNLSATMKSADSCGSCFLISGAAKMFSRQIHFFWHSSQLSMISWSWNNSWYCFSALGLNGLIYLLARRLLTVASPSSSFARISSTSYSTKTSVDSLQLFIFKSCFSHSSSNSSNCFPRLDYWFALTEISMISSWYDWTGSCKNSFRVKFSSSIEKSLFSNSFTSTQCSSFKYQLLSATITGIASLYSHTTFLNTGVTVLSGIVLSAIRICLAYFSQIVESSFTFTSLNIRLFHSFESSLIYFNPRKMLYFTLWSSLSCSRAQKLAKSVIQRIYSQQWCFQDSLMKSLILFSISPSSLQAASTSVSALLYLSWLTVACTSSISLISFQRRSLRVFLNLSMFLVVWASASLMLTKRLRWRTPTQFTPSLSSLRIKVGKLYQIYFMRVLRAWSCSFTLGSQSWITFRLCFCSTNSSILMIMLVSDLIDAWYHTFNFADLSFIMLRQSLQTSWSRLVCCAMRSSDKFVQSTWQIPRSALIISFYFSEVVIFDKEAMNVEKTMACSARSSLPNTPMSTFISFQNVLRMGECSLLNISSLWNDSSTPCLIFLMRIFWNSFQLIQWEGLKYRLSGLSHRSPIISSHSSNAFTYGRKDSFLDHLSIT